MGDTGDWKVVKNWIKMESRETLICVAVSAAALILSIAHIRTVLPFDPAWIAVVLCGVPILAGAGEGLFVRHDIKADVLVSIALVAALVTGQYFAAGEVALIMQIGSLLEDFTADRARKGLEKLIGMTPGLAHLQKGKGEWDDLPLDQIHPGDRIYILPGEMVPLDGEILEGSAVLDQSMMTGESLPVDKSVGDSVFSGCISRSRSFLMEVRKGNEDSSMQRLIRLTREAEEKKAPARRRRPRKEEAAEQPVHIDRPTLDKVESIMKEGGMNLDGDRIHLIAEAIKTTNTKNRFYQFFRKKLGETAGREFYISIRGEYEKLKLLREAPADNKEEN